MSITSDQINILIYRYLLESGNNKNNIIKQDLLIQLMHFHVKA